jgi:hypothetical protein
LIDTDQLGRSQASEQSGKAPFGGMIHPTKEE